MLKEFIINVLTKIINLFEDGDYLEVDRTYDSRCYTIPSSDLIQILRK